MRLLAPSKTITAWSLIWFGACNCSRIEVLPSRFAEPNRMRLDEIALVPAPSVRPQPLSVAGWLMMNSLLLGMENTVVPLGMFGPTTAMPATSPAVLSHSTAWLLFRVDAFVSTTSADGGVVVASSVSADPVAVAAELMLNEVLLLKPAIVAPDGMPVPLTGCPTDKPVVLAHVTAVEPEVVAQPSKGCADVEAAIRLTPNPVTVMGELITK